MYYSKQEDLEHAMTINYGLRVYVKAVPAGPRARRLARSTRQPGGARAAAVRGRCYAYTRRLRASTLYTRVFDHGRQMGSVNGDDRYITTATTLRPDVLSEPLGSRCVKLFPCRREICTFRFPLNTRAFPVRVADARRHSPRRGYYVMHERRVPG